MPRGLPGEACAGLELTGTNFRCFFKTIVEQCFELFRLLPQPVTKILETWYLICA